MSETTVTPNFEFGALIGKGVLLIIIGLLFCVFTFASGWAFTMLLSILLIFFGITLLCGGTSFGKMGVASIVLGILVIILGIITLLNPLVFQAFLVYFIGAASIVWGLFTLVTGIMGGEDVRRVLSIIIGALGILFGIFVFTTAFHLTTFLTAPILMYIAGIIILIYGIFSIIQAIVLKSRTKQVTE